MWPGFIAARLNTLLPPDYRSGVRVHVGTAVEIDVATFEQDDPTRPGQARRQRCCSKPRN